MKEPIHSPLDPEEESKRAVDVMNRPGILSQTLFLKVERMTDQVLEVHWKEIPVDKTFSFHLHYSTSLGSNSCSRD